MKRPLSTQILNVKRVSEFATNLFKIVLKLVFTEQKKKKQTKNKKKKKKNRNNRPPRILEFKGKTLIISGLLLYDSNS